MDMTNNEIVAGTQVSFRPEFSAELVGIEWSIIPLNDGSMVRTVQSGADRGKQFCQIERRVGRRNRRAARFAWISDLIAA